MKEIINLNKNQLLVELCKEGRQIIDLIKKAIDIKQLREDFFNFLNELERSYFNVFDELNFNKFHIIDKNNAKECIRVLKNIIRTENEQLTGYSALETLFNLIKEPETIENVSEGFFCEFIYLFRGIQCKASFNQIASDIIGNGEAAGKIRSQKLDAYAAKMQFFLSRHKIGLEDNLVERQRSLKNKILNYFRASESDWNNYVWHLKNVIKDADTLSKLVKLSYSELKGVELAAENGIPFQITPYYLSLFNENGKDSSDKMIRTMVLPSENYCSNVKKNRKLDLNMDFMDEKSTSPIKCITRRYPQILILKPYDSCPQICVYCQRNWEIKNMKDSNIAVNEIESAIEWIKNNKNITEVLVTGGDPLTLTNKFINNILFKLSEINHIERIRLGTRTLVTLPFRINDELVTILSKYHEFGKREICIVTHFGHPTEITPDVLVAINRIKRSGINIYNQQVFTYYNSFKFETGRLRKALKLCGIDPYYSFNTKGKEETSDFRVPIARIEQERKEEARFLPGIVRTDEPVFNVPRLGKSHLRAWQDHEPIMILESGQRIYRFYPWESKVALVNDYLYTDVSIYDYLKRLKDDGEDIADYQSIWYYF